MQNATLHSSSRTWALYHRIFSNSSFSPYLDWDMYYNINYRGLVSKVLLGGGRHNAIPRRKHVYWAAPLGIPVRWETRHTGSWDYTELVGIRLRRGV